jgi:hypothetical protein
MRSGRAERRLPEPDAGASLPSLNRIRNDRRDAMTTGDTKARTASGATPTQPTTRPSAAAGLITGPTVQQGDGIAETKTGTRPMQAFSASAAGQQGDAEPAFRQRPAGIPAGAGAESSSQGPSPNAAGRMRTDTPAGPTTGAHGGEYGRYSGGYGARTPSREDTWRAGRSPHEVSWTGSRPEPGGRPFDPEYHRWRAEQVRRMDLDYETWRQERYDKFCEEFDRWRAERAAQPVPHVDAGAVRREGSGN